MLKGYGTKGFSVKKTKLDKGHKNQFRLLVDSIQKGDQPIIQFDEIVNTSKASLAAIQSFKENEQAYLLDEHNDILDCIQVRYNLLEREAEKLLFPKAIKYGIGVIVRIPILFGLILIGLK